MTPNITSPWRCATLIIMLERFIQFAATWYGEILVLALAAYLEAQGDAKFNSGLHDSSGMRRIGLFVAGTLVLALYSLFLNWSKVDFNKLIGIYIVFFFWVAQLLAYCQKNQTLTKPIFVGGVFITAGGLIMKFWKG